MTVSLFDPRKDDAGLLAALHQSCFARAWDKPALENLLQSGFAFHNRDGFVLARVAGGEAEILTLAVAPAARGHGLGRALISAAAAHAVLLGATDIFLEVGVENPAALALYAGLGFRRVGQRKGYFDGQDAWVQRAALPLAPPTKFA